MIQIDSDMSDNCVECRLSIWNEEGYVCPFSGIPALNIGRQADCPLRELERKTGHWIRHHEQKNIYGGKCIECSECGEKYMVQYIEDEKFCRNCGADMRGEEHESC